MQRRPERKWDERRQIGAGGELARDDAPGEDEGLHGLFGPVDLVEEGDDVQHDQRNRHEGHAGVVVLVADRKHVNP